MDAGAPKSDPEDDQRRIDLLTAAFFASFSLEDGGRVNLERIHALFIPKGLIVKAVTGSFEAYDVAAFVAPRVALLNSGAFASFHEEEVSGTTEIFGNIAQRFGRYRKWGIQNGQAFEQFGTKTMQFVRTPEGWRISALAWDDDPL